MDDDERLLKFQSALMLADLKEYGFEIAKPPTCDHCIFKYGIRLCFADNTPLRILDKSIASKCNQFQEK